MDDFVGRASELEALASELELAKTGRPRVVLIEGDPGVGKSWLIREFLARTDDTLSVMRATGDEYEADLTCGLVNQLVASLKPRPSHMGGWAGDGDDVCSDPAALGGALLQLIGEVERAGPLVIVVDDAQWADRTSLQALTFALRRLHADHVLAIVATRTGATSLPHSLRRLVAERGRAVELEALTLADLQELVVGVHGSPLPERALRRLWEHTGGHPLHARALLEELERDVLVRSGGGLPAPRSFTLLVLARLAGCSAEARRLVEAVSVLGSSAELGPAARVADLRDPAEAVDQAVAAGLLGLHDTPAALLLAFPHSMVRAAIYDNLGYARRSELHTRAAELLDGAPALDHRAAAAMVEDEELADELSRRAGEEAARGDYASSARHLFSAARLSPHRAQRDRRVLDALELLLSAGEVREAKSVATDLANLPDSARRDYVLGHLALLDGRQQEAEVLLSKAWEGADPVAETEVRIMASEQMAQLCAFQIRPEETITWARRAMEGKGRSRAGSSAFTLLVVYLALVGRPGEALPLVESLPDDPHHLTPWDMAGMLGRGIVRLWISELEAARSDLTAVLEAICPALTSRTGLMTLGFLAQVEYLRGDLIDSARHADLAVAVATDGGQASFLPFLHATAGWVSAMRGDAGAAKAHVDAAMEAAQSLGDLSSMAWARDAEVRLAFLQHRYDRVVGIAEALARLPGREILDEPGVFAWRELYAEALVRLGRLDEAAAVLSALEEKLLTRPRRRLARAGAARVRGLLEAARNNETGARAAFTLAESCHPLEAAPLERAALDHAYGSFLRRAGYAREAARRLQGARDAYEALGARAPLERVEQELAACGGLRRHRAMPPEAHLTPQEQAVAKVVAEGRTNREVSELLFISRKTVEYHLSNIYLKLAISSRRQLRERFGAAT